MANDNEQDRWASQSDAFKAEQPWCGWVMAFAADSDCDTTGFGLERLVGLNILLTTADGHSRPVTITNWRASQGTDDTGGILCHELETEHYEPIDRSRFDFVAYQDIREIVVY